MSLMTAQSILSIVVDENARVQALRYKVWLRSAGVAAEIAKAMVRAWTALR